MPHPFAAIVSLGCAKNQVDSQIMARQLLDIGYTLTEDPSQAALILVNTCGFLQSAVEESIDSILELSRWKDEGPCRQLVVAGCMVQRYGLKLPESLPEVDLFLGTSHVHRLKDLIAAGQSAPDHRSVHISRPRELQREYGSCRVSDASPASVYLRVSDGCDNRCTFCMIPRLRGPLRNRPLSFILEEARRLAQEGVLEINLIAQDVTAYGSKGGRGNGLIPLLEGLESIAGIQWIRVMYAYPDGITDELLALMRGSDTILPYLDIPLQHSEPHILRKMRGRAPLLKPDELVDRIRAAIPGVTLRTTLMVGFPGETERDFEALHSFVEQARFDRLGVFAFSPEAGTPAARLPEQVLEEEKASRRHRLLSLQAGISRELLSRQVGRSLPVLVEGLHPETDLLITGRLGSQAPEVDGTVIITRGTAQPGRMVHVRVTRSHTYDLEGEVPTDREEPSDWDEPWPAASKTF